MSDRAVFPLTKLKDACPTIVICRPLIIDGDKPGRIFLLSNGYPVRLYHHPKVELSLFYETTLSKRNEIGAFGAARPFDMLHDMVWPLPYAEMLKEWYPTRCSQLYGFDRATGRLLRMQDNSNVVYKLHVTT